MKEGSNLLELFIEKEREIQESALDNAWLGELRPVSARIRSDAYEVLEQLAERWGMSKSGLAADVLEAALLDLKPSSPRSTPESRAL